MNRPDPDPAARDLEAATGLRRLADCAAAIGAATAAGEAIALADRVTEGRVHVACLGQFKRGKSTLLNALLDRPLLPTGVVPVTSVVTVLRFGASEAARVHHPDGSTEAVPVGTLADYVTDAGNPGNLKAVTVVEVLSPSAILRGGLCLVDTPGVGSTSPLASEATRAFVPHIDAALVVLGADPPISAEELHLLQDVNAETDRFVFAINKADKLSEAEVAEVGVYTQRLLTDRLGLVPDAMFIVSAAERLAGGGPPRDWGRLEQALVNLVGDARSGWLARRAGSVAIRIGRQVQQAIDEMSAAIERPVAESERRLADLGRWFEDAERTLREFGLLLAAEQRAVARDLSARAEAHSAAVRASAREEFVEACDAAALDWGPLRAAAFELARGAARRAVQRELVTLEDVARDAYRRAATRFVELGNGFLQRLAASEPRLAELPPLQRPDTLGGRRHFYFTEMMTLTASGPLDWVIDVLGSRSVRRRRAAARAGAYLDRLLTTNTSRVVNDVGERLDAGRRQLDREIRARMTELTTSAERATSKARSVHAAGEAARMAEHERLESLRRRVERAIASCSLMRR